MNYVYVLFNVLSILILLFFYVKDINKYKGLRLSIWYFAFTIIPTIISLIIIENGVYISEQKRYGYLNLSTIIYIIYSVILYIGMRIGYFTFTKVKYSNNSKNNIRLNSTRKKIIIGLLIGTLISLIVLYLNYFFSPKPYINLGITRFNYWENSYFPFLRSIFGNVSGFIAIFLGLIFFYYNSKFGLIVYIFYFFYLILVGNKFSALIIVIFLFFIPKLFVVDSLLKLIEKNLIKIIFILIFFFFLIYLNYMFFNPYKYAGYNNILDAILQRIAIQGHVFWGSVNYINSYNILVNPEDIIYGMRTLMRLVSFQSESVIDYHYNNGMSTFTLGYPSILNIIIVFPLGFFIQFLVGIIFGIIFFIISLNLYQKRIILSILSMQVLSWFNYMFTMAKFERLLSLEFWIIITMLVYTLFISLVIDKKITKKRI